MQTVHTVVRTARNVVIVSVGVTEVGETMVDKDVGKGKALFCNWTRTQNHLVLKRTLNHLARLA